MAVPAVITDLLVAAADNVPKGTDAVTTSTGPDEFFRAHAAIVRRLHAKGADVASAATVDLGAINDGSYVNITGTTTITSFGTIAAGVERTLLFADALTLTHDAAKIILPGAANIVTVAEDVAVFVSEGAGLWRCKSYQRKAVPPSVPLDASVVTAKIADDAVTYAKIQNVSATDKLLGRATAGAGDVEEITCTPFARTLLDDVTSNDVLTTLTTTRAESGAAAVTVLSKLRESVSVKDFGAVGDGVANDSSAIQAALNSGAKRVDGLGIQSLIATALTIPAGVEFVNANLKAGTAGMNMVLVNTGCTLTGKLTGTGTVTIVERGVYPAATGVTDVKLDVEVSNITFGVHAAAAGGTSAKRWKGRVYAHDIVGTAGESEGYGVLLETTEDCELVVHALTIKRHALYLTAGSKRNRAEVHVNGCANYAVQMYSTATQTETSDNEVTIFSQNLTQDVSPQSGPVAIIQKSNRNTVRVFAEGNDTTSSAVWIEGASGGPYPTGNKVIGGSISGQFIGNYVVSMINADSTIVSGNLIHAYAVAGVVGMLRSGTNDSVHGGRVEGNQINAQAQSIKGIYNECNTQPSFIGVNDIRNNGTGLRVDDQTAGKRQGFSRRIAFSGTTASIGATVSGDTSVTLSDNIQTTGRSATVTLTGASAQFFDKPFWTGIISAADEVSLGFRVYNGHSAAQTFNYSGWVEGD